MGETKETLTLHRSLFHPYQVEHQTSKSQHSISEESSLAQRSRSPSQKDKEAEICNPVVSHFDLPSVPTELAGSPHAIPLTVEEVDKLWEVFYGRTGLDYEILVQLPKRAVAFISFVHFLRAFDASFHHFKNMTDVFELHQFLMRSQKLGKMYPKFVKEERTRMLPSVFHAYMESKLILQAVSAARHCACEGAARVAATICVLMGQVPEQNKEELMEPVHISKQPSWMTIGEPNRVTVFFVAPFDAKGDKMHFNLSMNWQAKHQKASATGIRDCALSFAKKLELRAKQESKAKYDDKNLTLLLKVAEWEPAGVAALMRVNNKTCQENLLAWAENTMTEKMRMVVTHLIESTATDESMVMSAINDFGEDCKLEKSEEAPHQPNQYDVDAIVKFLETDNNWSPVKKYYFEFMKASGPKRKNFIMLFLFLSQWMTDYPVEQGEERPVETFCNFVLAGGQKTADRRLSVQLDTTDGVDTTTGKMVSD